MLNLNNFTKELIVRGVYSLFELYENIEEFSYVLVTSNNSGFLIDEFGKFKPISNLDSIKLGKIITINDITILDSVLVDNV
jgi:hypothetical protein